MVINISLFDAGLNILADKRSQLSHEIAGI
jgi:hypothetical protein